MKSVALARDAEQVLLSSSSSSSLSSLSLEGGDSVQSSVKRLVVSSDLCHFLFHNS